MIILFVTSNYNI